jgi:hypothetical protein
VDSSNTFTSASGVNGSDTYGFIGPNAANLGGSYIPNVPADSYAGHVTYTLTPA